MIAFDRNGAAAGYVTAPAADLADRPRSVSHTEAASLPLAALTAWQALTDQAGLQPGERVLVQGGGGGVGVYAVQLAAILGADVTATGRAGQGDFVRSLGARTFTQDAGDADFAGRRVRPGIRQGRGTHVHRRHHDDTWRIMHTLRRNVGDGNFHYLMGLQS